MDAIYSMILSVPMFQNSLLLLVSTIALLFGRIKLALLINYCFTLYWGYVLNIDVLQENGATITSSFTYMYFGFGLLILILAIVGFITQE